jgi:hypothetical protein
MLLVLFKNGHGRCACFSDATDSSQVLAHEMQSIVVAVGFEEYSEIPVSEQAPRTLNHDAFHRLVGHLREHAPELSALSRANLD